MNLFADPTKPADPFLVAASPDLVPAMVSNRASRNGYAGSSDRLPPVYRAGSMDALALPSRMGDRLVFRDGTTREA